jgi:hypothetical protein
MLMRISVASVFYCLVMTNVVSATAIFESGTLGPVGVSEAELLNQTVAGTNVNSQVFVGSRFHLTQPATATRIGGHFVSGQDGGKFFGAIVRLSNSTDFPDSDDLSTADVLAAVQLTFPSNSDEVFATVNLNLAPDWYAIVFGSGLFDTDGYGGAVRNGLDIGAPSYLAWQPSAGWFNIDDLGFGGLPNHRFVIEGEFVPEPSTNALLIAGAVFIATTSTRSRRTTNVFPLGPKTPRHGRRSA